MDPDQPPSLGLEPEQPSAPQTAKTQQFFSSQSATNGATGPQTEPSASNGQVGASQASMSEDEIALYDRQIRLWGMRAQEQIRSANVLLINARALGNEIAKNLVLAGIGALTILDHHTVTPFDLGAQFLLAPQSAAPGAAGAAGAAGDGTAASSSLAVGMNRAQAIGRQLTAMNPRVRITIDESDVSSKGPSFYQPFSLIIATDLDPDSLNIINTVSRLVHRPFYAANSYGYFGYIFADLIEHDFFIVRDRGNVPTQPGTSETRTCTVIGVQAESGVAPNHSNTGNGHGSSNGNGTAAPPPPSAKETITKRELYSTWLLASDAARLPAAFMQSPRRMRKVTPVLPCLRALWDFQQTHDSRLPSPASTDDLQQFVSLVERKQKALGTPPVSSQFVRQFLQGIMVAPVPGTGVPVACEISPVATVLGGQLAQDAINVLGHTQQPIQNLLVFDGINTQALTYSLHPDGELGHPQLTTAAGLPAPDSTTACVA